MLDSYWQTLYQQSLKISVSQGASAPLTLNHELSATAYVASRESLWLPSPAKGVKRLMLERDGGEKTTRATSIVAYDPDSRFSAHKHPLGEEFLVLSGTFSDEHGDYPAGTYVRNPPGTSHAPKSKDGCLIWVKLQQFQAADKQAVICNLFDSKQQMVTLDIGLQGQILFDDYEQVSYVNIIKAQQVTIDKNTKGVEILVLGGNLSVNINNLHHNHCQSGDWIRIASGSKSELAISKDTTLLIKTGHLSC